MAETESGHPYDSKSIDNRRHLAGIVSQFAVPGDLVAAEPYGSGHINDTYAVTMNQAGSPVRYILQRINTTVFADVSKLMDNIRRVTEQQHRWLGSAPDGSRRALTIVPTRDGKPYLLARGGEPWRAYLFIEGATTYDVIQSPEQAVEAAAAFGEFQNQLAELSAPGLYETIPGFHDTPQRLQKLLDAIERDSLNRAVQVEPELQAIMNRAALCSYLEDKKATGELPVRTTHNDTKLNNVMLDTKTGKAVCVIDLDTVMPGLSAYDFGDLVRTSTSPAAEDERDLGKVDFRLEMFEALVQGFLSTAGTFLTPTERQVLLVAGQVITLETGIRFLTDFLQGDVYFRIHRPQHNLDRCRTQLKLVERMEQAKEQAGNILTKWERHYRLR